VFQSPSYTRCCALVTFSICSKSILFARQVIMYIQQNILDASIWAACLWKVVVTAPVAQVPGYTDASFPLPQSPQPGSPAISFGPDVQVSAILTRPPSGTESGAAPPRITSNPTGHTSHGPFSGTPSTTGAVQASTTLALSIGPLPPNPTATYYNAEGKLLQPAPAPYTPDGLHCALQSLILLSNFWNRRSWDKWHRATIYG
jgi:hypothetical protein